MWCGMLEACRLVYAYCGFLEEDVWGLQVLRLIGFCVRGL